jgi:uncharacterized protein (TIGR02246 family)
MPFTGPAEDRLAIRELIEAYADAVCRADAQDWGALWAEDAVWHLPEYPDIGEVRGRDAIVAMWVEAMKHYPGIIFIATPGAIDVLGDHATARSYTSEVYDQGGVTRRDRGRYDDELVRTPEGWRFARRTFRKLHAV